MKYRIVCLLLLLLFTLSSFSQPPGYMGKRLAVYYNPVIFLSLHKEADAYKPGLNLRNDFSADFTVSKSVAIGGSVKLISTKLYNALYQGPTAGGIYEFFSGDLKLRGQGISVYIKKFAFEKRGYIAPAGFFNKFECCYTTYKGTTASLDLNMTGDQFVPLEAFDFNPHHASAGFIYSFGRQSVYFDRLFLSTGGSFGIMLPLAVTSGAGSIYPEYEILYRKEAGDRILGYFLFNINIGIGFLAL